MADDVLTLEEEQEADSLQERDGDGQEAAPADELRAAGLSFLEIGLLHLREDDSPELHDNGRGDVGAHPEHHDREAREPAAREDVQEAEELVAREERGERILVDARNGHRREETEERERADEEKDARADLLVAEGEFELADERINH